MNGGRNFSTNRPEPAGALSGMSTTGDTAFQTPQQRLYINERQRRSRLVRIVSLGLLISMGLLIPTSLIPVPDMVTLVAVLLAFVGAGVGYLLNRFQFVNAAGYAVLVGGMLALGWEVVGQSLRQGGLDLNDLRVYDLFVLPIILSAVLLTRRGPIILGALSIAFTISSILLLPKAIPLQQYWDGVYAYAIGSSYDVVIVPVILQGLAATAAWLGADSVRRALLQAYRVEEISAAKVQVEEQQRQLQRGIANIQQVHSAVANGQWDARAQVDAAELIPLAVSLNLLLDRISRLSRDQEQRQRIDRSAHELALALRRLRLGEAYTPPPFTGTALDEVLMELDVLRTVRPSASAPSHGSVPAWPSSPGGGQGNTPAGERGPAMWPPVVSKEQPANHTGAPQSWPAIQPESGSDQTSLPRWLRES